MGNQRLLIDKIGLRNVPVLNAGPYFQAKTGKSEGCQIDLMLRTKGSLYVFEVKCRKQISIAAIAEVKMKVARLKIDPSLTVRTGLIFQGQLDPAFAKTDYFDYLIPFEKLLE